jgi:hypothetical protein
MIAWIITNTTAVQKTKTPQCNFIGKTINHHFILDKEVNMSVEVYGVKEIRIRYFPEGASQIWFDTKTESGDLVNMTVRISPETFLTQMYEALSQLNSGILTAKSIDVTISKETPLAPRVETQTTRV